MLSAQQEEAIASIKKWQGGGVYKLAGYAGTGKTFLVAQLPVLLPGSSYTFVAPTGKAAANLTTRLGGRQATTIHKAIYKLVDTIDGELEFEDDDSKEATARILVVDEASMVNGEMLDDLAKRHWSILLVGDAFQLPPVRGEAVFSKYDYLLTDVHRQDEASTILKFASALRGLGEAPADDNTFFEIGSTEPAALDADVYLCWTNSDRVAANKRIREHRGMLGSPQEGDVMICLLNNEDVPIMNGERFTLLEHLGGQAWRIKKEGYDIEYSLALDFCALNHSSPKFNFAGLTGIPCDYGYALTVHKAQGSEWPHVHVRAYYNGDMPARWLYTAVTRAREKLTYST